MRRAPTRRRRPAPVSPGLERLGERVRRARAEAGLSQAQLGAPHFTRAYISAIELGKTRPAMKSLEFIAGRLGKAVSYFVEDEESERRRKEVGFTTTRAAQLIAEGRADEAISLLEAAVAAGTGTAERIPLLRLLGRAYVEGGDGAKAAAVLRDVLRHYESIGDAEQVARTRGQLGGALIALMAYSEAAEHLSEALRATAESTVRDPLFRVHTLHNMGVAFYGRGEFTAALQYFELAEREGADIGDPKWLASLMAAVGMARYQVGDFEGAVTSLAKSEVLFDSIRNRQRVAEIRFQRARTLRAMGHRNQSREAIDQALELARAAGATPLAIRIQVSLGLWLVEDGDEAVGIQRLEASVAEADAIKLLPSRFMAKFGLGKGLAKSSPERAEMLLRQAADLVSSTRPPELADLYAELSALLARRGLPDEALSYANRAYDIARKK